MFDNMSIAQKNWWYVSDDWMTSFFHENTQLYELLVFATCLKED